MTKDPKAELEPRENHQLQIIRDDLVETSHTVIIAGQEVSYKVITGTMLLKEEPEVSNKENAEVKEFQDAKAAVFFVAYMREGIKDFSKRPITFSFNGGPGSSSVWLHLGLLGPRRVWMDEIGNAPPPPFKLIDNEYSLLDITDLVFIDPVSTGFSRAIPGEKPDQFHGFKKDIESVGDFIRLFMSRYQRWASPKFLIGESYGTTRAAGLSGYLQDRHGMFLNGIMLISSVLNFQTLQFDPGNDLPYIGFLPTYAATAWYHQLLTNDLQSGSLYELVDKVKKFSAGPYNLALTKGAGISQAEKLETIAALQRFTGLSADFIDRTNLRINIYQFCKELLRHERLTVGRLDARFKGIDRDSVGEQFEFDPSYTNILGPFTAMLNHYIRSELNFESDLPYEILTGRVQPWSYQEHQNKYVDVAETLRRAMTMNPHLKVYIANGYYDLATPFFATEYTVNHLNLDPALRENISLSYFEAGHMMYIHLPSLHKIRGDLVGFINGAVPVLE